MRIHYLQHAHFEGPAAIADWAAESGHAITGTHLYKGDALPEPDSFDLLVIMGGPMSVNDEQEYPWLVEEKRLVKRAVESGCAVLGVCLGAQMIANALNAPVYRAGQKEIGWFPVRRVTKEGVGCLFPDTFTPLHWHGETFDLPKGALRLAASDAVPNQAFQWGEKTVGLQFHLESTPRSVHALTEFAAADIEENKPFQQAAEEILARTPQASAAVRSLLWKLLDHLTDSGQAAALHSSVAFEDPYAASN